MFLTNRLSYEFTSVVIGGVDPGIQLNSRTTTAFETSITPGRLRPRKRFIGESG